MNWNTLASAFVGGIFGGGLGSMVAYMQLRSDRAQVRRTQQWADAEVIADAKRLLSDLHPRLSVNRSPAAEPEYWDDLRARSLQVGFQLTRVAAGHPSVPVQKAAEALSVALTEVRHSDRRLAQISSGGQVTGYEQAEYRWESANKKVDELAAVVKDVATPGHRVMFRRRHEAASNQPAI